MELHNAPASVLRYIAQGVFAVLFAISALGGPANAVEVMTATGYQHSAYLADDGTVW